MNSNSVSLIIAIVGVVGTLAASLFAQYSNIHAKKLELEHHRETYKHEERQLNLRERRQAYIAFNAAIRNYRRAIKNRIYEFNDQTEVELQQARQEFDSRYAEAQLIAHSEVLELAHSVSTQLSDSFGRVKQFDQSRRVSANAARDHSVQNELTATLNGPIASEIALLRKAMREDLGVAGRA